MIYPGINGTNQDIVIADNYIAKRYNIITTKTWVHCVYEKTNDILNTPFGTITYIKGELYGRLGTRSDTPRLEQIYKTETILKSAFPFLKDNKIDDMAEIAIVE